MANMFDENGNYNKTEWKPGDRITAGKLNKIEESLEAINNNDIERHKEADERLDALEEQKEAVNDRFDELEDLVADNKTEVDTAIYEVHSKMDRLEQEMNDGIDTVEAIAHTVDDKIAEADASMKAQVAEVEADLEGLHAKDEELTSQLAHIENKISICPDDLDFEKDEDKIQYCLDLAKNENVEILLNRVYSIENTCYIDKGYANFILFKGCNGGGLHKEGDGFMFSSTLDNNNRGNIHFENVHFTGENGCDNPIIDADRMIRIFFNYCTFKYIKCMKSTVRPLQTFRFTRNIVQNHNGDFIDINRCFDVRINNNQVEASYYGSFLYFNSAVKGSYEYYSLIIDDNLFEGYVNNAVFSISNCGVGLSICKNYFEANKYEVNFTNTESVKNSGRTMQFTFSNNFISQGECVFNGMENMVDCKVFLRNNEISNKQVFNVVSGLTILGKETNSFISNSSISDVNFPEYFTEKQTIYGKVIKEYIEGVGVKITLQDFLCGSYIARAGETLLLNIRADYGDNNIYFNNYLGLISFTGEYDTTTSLTCLRLYQTDLFNKSGSTGSQSCGVTVAFSDGSLKISNTKTPTDRDLIITVTSSKTINNIKLSVIPLSQILLASNSHLYRS